MASGGLYFIFTSQFTILINYLCALYTTLRIQNTWNNNSDLSVVSCEHFSSQMETCLASVFLYFSCSMYPNVTGLDSFFHSSFKHDVTIFKRNGCAEVRTRLPKLVLAKYWQANKQDHGVLQAEVKCFFLRKNKQWYHCRGWQMKVFFK